MGLDPYGGPLEFAKKIAQYDLLPTALVPVFTLAVLGIELVLGICLLIGRWLRTALWLCVPLFVAFGTAVAYAILTHKQIDCGCFGNQPVPATWGNLVRDDLVPLGIVGVLLWLQYRKPSTAQKTTTISAGYERSLSRHTAALRADVGNSIENQ